MATLFEFYFNDQMIHKTKITCIPLDMSRIVNPREDESNFRIFYQMFAGLNPKDRAKLQLQTHIAHELRYLYNYPAKNQVEVELLQKEFQSWKLALQILGIPFYDVAKVLAAILLLGNVQFTEKSQRVLEVQGGDFELKAVAVLLGVPYTSLFRGLTKRIKTIKNDATLQSCSATKANYNCDALAKTLYSRMLSVIIRRCNCSRKNGSPPYAVFGSNLDASTPDVSVNVDDKMLGIADLFGFDNCRCNGMEQLCVNLFSETIQHFYATHIFKSAEGFCREEEFQNEVDLDYVDNSQCIELLTCQETGILTYLDQETLNDGKAEHFVEKIRAKHVGREKFFTTSCAANEFGIAHYITEVIYDADELLRSNDVSIADDVIQMFSAEQCSFGFVVHLFALELQTVPETDEFGSFHSSSIRTFCQEFQEKLDGLLKTLIHAEPSFVICIKSNLNAHHSQFDSGTISRQIQSLQIFETVHLMRSGCTHRMRLIPFAQRYFLHDDELTQNDALEIAQSYQKMLNEGKGEYPSKIFYIGKKHVFFSEMLWQDLEKSRPKRKHSQNLRRNSFESSFVLSADVSPISRDEPLGDSRSEIEGTPPAIPKRRGYTVIDNKKIAFPQVRVMTQNYRDTVSGQDVVFTFGESVKVTGASPKAGYLAVESRHKTGWVPYKLTRLVTDEGM